METAEDLLEQVNGLLQKLKDIGYLIYDAETDRELYIDSCSYDKEGDFFAFNLSETEDYEHIKTIRTAREMGWTYAHAQEFLRRFE